MDYQNELDIFTLNFEEELSAFGGDVMYSETEFVNDCINTILKLYELE
ncbi:GPI inositol-deacylase [Klebsiella aerogenes]